MCTQKISRRRSASRTFADFTGFESHPVINIKLLKNLSLCRRLRKANRELSPFDWFMFPYVALAKDKIWQPGPYAGDQTVVD